LEVNGCERKNIYGMTICGFGREDALTKYKEANCEKLMINIK
jgi:hypothetical protein